MAIKDDHVILVNAIEDNIYDSCIDDIIKKQDSESIYDYMTLAVECNNLHFLKKCYDNGIDLSMHNFGLVISANMYDAKDCAMFVYEKYKQVFNIEKFKNGTSYDSIKKIVCV